MGEERPEVVSQVSVDLEPFVYLSLLCFTKSRKTKIQQVNSTPPTKEYLPNKLNKGLISVECSRSLCCVSADMILGGEIKAESTM